MFARVVYTPEGVIALLQGCPLLTEVVITAGDKLPKEVRKLRPEVTFEYGGYETCSFWQTPEMTGDAY
jgi:hypothetical protein